MIKFERLKTLALHANNTLLRKQSLPELVHLDDPAYSVMIDFTQTAAQSIKATEDMEEAMHEMKYHGTHLLIVTDAEERIIGIITSEDLLGERPITIIQERRIDRTQVRVDMLMTPINDIMAFDIDHIERARVGNVVATLQEHHQHYALVVKHGDAETQIVRGYFSTSQISKQLHRNVASKIAKAQSVSELQKRSR